MRNKHQRTQLIKNKNIKTKNLTNSLLNEVQMFLGGENSTPEHGRTISLKKGVNEFRNIRHLWFCSAQNDRRDTFRKRRWKDDELKRINATAQKKLKTI